MKLTAFEYGESELPERMVFQDGSENVKVPIALLFFLIEDGGRKILVDTGCDTMPGFPLFAFQKPVDVLESYGVKRHKITDVLITHAHHDHIDGLHYYPQANVYIQEKEALLSERYIGGKENVYTFRDRIFLGNNICFQCIGGHSIGSSIVLIHASDNVYVLCGDECYTAENLLQAKPTGSSCNLNNSISFVNEYRKNAYHPILFHDKDLIGRIGYKTLFHS